VVVEDTIENSIVVDCFNNSHFEIVPGKMLIEVLPGAMAMCKEELNIQNDSA
jgi:hypothetical protein